MVQVSTLGESVEDLLADIDNICEELEELEATRLLRAYLWSLFVFFSQRESLPQLRRLEE